ncbi:MAG: hypothetical protein A2157_16440 [Deltaproteobacteria bacterium RBG_16_47_11]|nr:MAG: hypothetical protein A2157_16440 [Deltaproteobacteria bacterium RBG_16_47_11]
MMAADSFHCHIITAFMRTTGAIDQTAWGKTVRGSDITLYLLMTGQISFNQGLLRMVYTVDFRLWQTEEEIKIRFYGDWGTNWVAPSTRPWG